MRTRPVATKCIYCETDTEPNYKDVTTLQKYLTERGKMLGRTKNGLCTSHQRHYTKEVKRARFMALLPYIVRA